ncbi:hypothetical protein L208DRAFT_1407005 [Tricholoma matsutake]|nr:hypothetical protein L208DRAFT_1407005 [Tricholoma matsutake 945]
MPLEALQPFRGFNHFSDPVEFETCATVVFGSIFTPQPPLMYLFILSFIGSDQLSGQLEILPKIMVEVK